MFSSVDYTEMFLIYGKFIADGTRSVRDVANTLNASKGRVTTSNFKEKPIAFRSLHQNEKTVA